jgi:hypothetical protein
MNKRANSRLRCRCPGPVAEILWIIKLIDDSMATGLRHGESNIPGSKLSKRQEEISRRWRYQDF